jgi:hypothetical protein
MKLYTKPLIALLIACFITGMLQAQMISDIVYLKNGTVIKGMIVEQVPGKTIKVRTHDNLLIEINYQEIARIVKEETYAREGGKTELRINGLRKYFFKGNIGFYTGETMGYTFGVSAGLRLGNFDLAASFQKLIPEDRHSVGSLTEKYDQFDLRMYALKGFYHISPGRALDPYVGLGAGYSASPKTKGAPKNASGTIYYGYYDSYFVNPAAGIEIPVAKNTFLFAELNYNWHRWTNTFAFVPNLGLPPREHVGFFSLVIGAKF